MSILVGPSRLARSACDSCGELCLDEELAYPVECMPDKQHCEVCAEAILARAEAEAEYDRNNADRTDEHEPRWAF